MRISDQFLDCYNKIDKYLTDLDDFDFSTTYSQKVIKLAERNSVIRRFKNELLTYGKLRNAIVHNPKIGSEPIAEPHRDILSNLEKIYKEVTNPIKVFPKYKCKILGASNNEYINSIMQEMTLKSFSQFPVFEKDKVIELITTNTISRWLSNILETDGTLIIEQVRIKDLVPFIEFPKNYKFIAKNTNVYQAYDYFANCIFEEKRNLDVLFITDSGKDSEGLLGIITIEDIAQFAR
jgi:hypothetical protein